MVAKEQQYQTDGERAEVPTKQMVTKEQQYQTDGSKRAAVPNSGSESTLTVPTKQMKQRAAVPKQMVLRKGQKIINKYE